MEHKDGVGGGNYDIDKVARNCTEYQDGDSGGDKIGKGAPRRGSRREY